MEQIDLLHIDADHEDGVHMRERVGGGAGGEREEDEGFAGGPAESHGRGGTVERLSGEGVGAECGVGSIHEAVKRTDFFAETSADFATRFACFPRSD